MSDHRRPFRPRSPTGAFSRECHDASRSPKPLQRNGYRTMRDFKGMKRQRGRNRGGGGGPVSNGKPQQNANRAFDSNGPDNIKVRGHAQHVFEKYQQLARDASSAGDRVLAENFLQHAEHYFRVLRTLQPNRPVADFIARDTFASGYDIDFEDESGAQAAAEEPQGDSSDAQTEADARPDYRDQQREQPPRDQRDRQPREDRPYRDDRQQRFEGQRDGQNRDGQNRDGQNRDGQARDRNGYRDRAPRDDRSYRTESAEGEVQPDRVQPDRVQGERHQNERAQNDRGQRDRQPREDRPYRDDRGDRRDRNFEPRGERPDPLAVVEPQAEPLTPVAITPAAAPAPIAAVEDTGGSMLRSRDGEVSHAPAFLQAATTTPAPSADDAPVKRPRGRPRKRPLEETSAPETEEA